MIHLLLELRGQQLKLKWINFKGVKHGTLKRTDFKNLIQNGPFFSARQTNSQSISDSTYVKVQFPTEIADPSGTYDNSTNYRFTPGVVGKYIIGAQVTMKDMSIDKKVQLALYENGSNMNSGQAASMTQTSINENITVQFNLLLDVDSTSDYYEVYIFQNKGVTKTSNTEISVNYVTNRLNPDKSGETFDHALEVRPSWYVEGVLHLGKNTLVVNIPENIVKELQL